MYEEQHLIVLINRIWNCDEMVILLHRTFAFHVAIYTKKRKKIFDTLNKLFYCNLLQHPMRIYAIAKHFIDRPNNKTL